MFVQVALNKELVPPDLANDDGEVCAVEDIEMEEDVLLPLVMENISL
jgi:hypothetical protein